MDGFCCLYALSWKMSFDNILIFFGEGYKLSTLPLDSGGGDLSLVDILLYIVFSATCY